MESIHGVTLNDENHRLLDFSAVYQPVDLHLSDSPHHTSQNQIDNQLFLTVEQKAILELSHKLEESTDSLSVKFVIFEMELFLIMQIAINSAIERLECFQECIGLISCKSSLTSAEIWLNLSPGMPLENF